MEDEKYVFFQDLKEKKVTGYSARKQRSHCGKGGRVKLPSDYLTKKEIKAMSGECKSYRLNSPMTWREFRAMPEDLQIAYIKAIKEKYNPTITAIGKMMGVERANLSKYLHGLGFEKASRGDHPWDKEGFAEWCFGVPKTEDCQSVQEEAEEVISAEETEEILNILGEAPYPNETEEETLAVDEVKKLCEEVTKDSEKAYAIPVSGSLSFTGNAVTILNTLGDLLGYKKVRLTVNFDVVEE